MVTQQIVQRKPSRSVVLHGLGGSGKTQLAIQYCAQCEFRKSVWAIFWAKASTKASMENSFDEIWGVIRHPRMTQTSETPGAKVDYVKRTMSTWSRPWLLVLDNYDDLDGFPGIMEFLPQSKFGRILLTSRLQDLPRYGFHHNILVEGLDERVAVNMLVSRAGMANEDTEVERHAKIIVNRLGRLPLAIDQAAAYISGSYDTLSNFTTEFDSIKAEVLNALPHNLSYVKSGPDGREFRATICSTWELSFRMIKNETPRTQKVKGHVLTLLAYLDAKNISDEIFAQPLTPWNEMGEQLLREGLVSKLVDCYMLSGRIWNMSVFYRLIEELTSLSLIQQFGRSPDHKHRIFSFHPLVREWLKIRSNAEERERCFFVAVCLLYGCVAAHQRSSTGQQMLLSPEGDIQILRHLAALDTDARLEMQSEVPGNIFETLHPMVRQMSQTMSAIRAQKLRQQMQEIGQWLSVLNPREHHSSILDRAAPGTGSSLLDSDEFGLWTASSGDDSLLWLIGDGGTGKTFTTAATISYLEEVFLRSNGSNSAVIFFYIRDEMDYTTFFREIFGSLLKQLLTSQHTQTLVHNEVAKVRELYEQHLAGKVTDGLLVILGILQDGIRKLKNCYIIIDGLDVCPDHILRMLFRNLTHLLDLTHVKLMITSRDSEYIRHLLATLTERIIEFHPVNTAGVEKKLYIHSRISRWEMKQDLKDRVEKIVLRQSQENFLYLRVLLDDLEGIRTDEDFDRQVATLPSTLDEFLEQRLTTIDGADDETRRHTLLMIAWVLCAQAPVPLVALLPVFYPRLAVEDSTGAVQYFQRVTGNLIIFDDNLGVPRFAHSSVKEYLEASRLGRWSSARRFISQPGPATGLRNLPYDHASFAVECMKLLSQGNFDFGMNGPSQHQAQTLAFECPFLKYAAVYWGVHVKLYQEDARSDDRKDDRRKEITTHAVNFLTDKAKLKTSLVIARCLKESGENKENPLVKLTPESTALDVAESFGLSGIVKGKLFGAQ
ncbi:hypothetical protein DL95DRAFT_471738 [Leptodontidium sp. 2 PMI_412]|nr:hypothetical protein DL95DRAFT_471738 [Leptodontidium sp. 2 PMI_412]